MTGHSARGAAAPRAVLAGVVAVAWSTAMTAVLLGVLTGEDWSGVLRLVVTAAVYAPVAGVLLGRAGSLALGGILGALAVANGVLALTTMLSRLADGPGDVLTAVALIARLPEVAALGVVPWLLVAPVCGRRGGLVLGAAAVGLDLLVGVFRLTGVVVARPIEFVSLVLALTSLVWAGFVLARQWRTSDSREREALLWFGGGAALLLVSYTRVAVPLTPLGLTLTDATFVLAQALLPTGVMALALGRAEGAREGRLFSSAVVVQSLAVGVSLYLLTEQAAVLAGLPPQIAGAFGAAVLAVTYSAVTGFIRRRVTRLCFASRIDARDVLARLGDRLEGAGSDAEHAIRALAESLRDIWELASVGLTPFIDAPAVLVGQPGPAAASIDLNAGGRQVAVLEVTGRDSDLEVSVPVLREVAALLAVAVLLASVNTEVAETRRRTLGVRREERRMLSRELLDGLAPSLAGIGFGMAGAGHRLASGAPIGADVAVLRAEVAAGAADVRRLARALLPTALDAGDLDAALAEFAQRLTAEGVPVDVRSAGADVLDGDRQVSIYLAVSGMLTRLVRLDDVSAVGLDLAIVGDDVRLDVVLPPVADGSATGASVHDAVARLAREVGGSVEVVGGDDLAFRVVMRR